MPTNTLFASSGVGIISLLTAPSILRLGQRARGGKHAELQIQKPYHNKQGCATEKTEELYAAQNPQISIWTATFFGLATSLAGALFVTIRHESSNFSDSVILQTWLHFSAWIFICLQSLTTSIERVPSKRYDFGICASISSVLLFILILGLAFQLPSDGPDIIVLLALGGVQLVAALVAGLQYLKFPARPDVFYPEGKLVERQYAVSAFSRYTFGWANATLRLASTRRLELDDLPVMDAATRSNNLLDTFNSMPLRDSVHLWKRLFWAYSDKILSQWFLTIVTAILSFAPQYSMLQLLRYLERRHSDSDIFDPEAWLWVFTLGSTTMLSVAIQNRLNWIAWSQISVPLRAQLSAIIFEKAMRRKDCKEPPKEEQDDSDSKTTPNESAENGDASNKTTENGDASNKTTENGDASNKTTPTEKKDNPTEQDTINLIAVDALQIIIFVANNQFYINVVVRFFLAITFLLHLVGWQALLAGLATNVVSYPLNSFFASRYWAAESALMKGRDRKTVAIKEVLGGIRQIKFSALEERWEERLNDIRGEELRQLWKASLANVFQDLVFTTGPVLLACTTLLVYTYLHGDLSPAVAFTSIGVFLLLQSLLGSGPDLISIFVRAKVSANRINTFLGGPEKVVNAYPGDSISFSNVSVTFPSDSPEVNSKKFILKDVNVDFPNNELSVISGKTGSGKTLLLNAILGEVDVLSGIIRTPVPLSIAERFDSKAVADNWILPSSIAYVAQVPWIENDTIKNNILFGLPFDPTRYEQVIKSCALTKDLAMFTDGDSTEVGAQGISLSGGQRWRLTLARALYSRAGILILDDLFSALDAHVGKYIYDNALTGKLAEGRTRILVTHHVGLCLAKTKYVVRLKDGAVEFAGMVEELAQTGKLDEVIDSDEDTSEASQTGGGEAANTNGSSPADEPAVPKKLVEDETRETGAVKLKVWGGYLAASGGFTYWPFIFICFIAAQALVLGRSWWIKTWTSGYEESHDSHILHSYQYQAQMMSHRNSSTPDGVSVHQGNVGYYLGVYAIISMLGVFLGAIRYFWIYCASIRASRVLFQRMTHAILRTPLRWLDTVPIGRIINRFTTDFTQVDEYLSFAISQSGQQVFELIGVLVAPLFIEPYILVFSLGLLAICAHIGRYYIAGAREVKRLEAITRSPVLEQFGSALKGLSTIRAYTNVPMFMDRMHLKVDNFTKTWWHNWLFNQWVSFNLSMTGSLFSAVVAALVVTTPGIDASLAGFALVFALEYSETVVRAIRLFAFGEMAMNAAERVLEYSNLKTEPQDGIDVPASWPSEGKIEVDNLVVSYADDLPSILKGLSFKADGNQRIGVVGRTGAGKSTLSLAIYRFLEAREGSITIDGIDISKIKLTDLRTRLAIIPQDPVLFSGTIRTNLDPFNRYQDSELMESLQQVHLIPKPGEEPTEAAATSEDATSEDASGHTNRNIFKSLSSAISEGGNNISQGQKQLVCLAREIISRPKIMILDEATSAVDMATDALIQRTIREEFSNTTLLVVAHRLSTVVDFDRILVLSDGVAAEFGTPRELMELGGVFSGMVNDSGDKEMLHDIIFKEVK